MNKNNYIHFRLSDEELKKLDIVCESKDCNRTDLIRTLIEWQYKKIKRKENK